MEKLICIETGKTTRLETDEFLCARNIDPDKKYTRAATRLIRREPKYSRYSHYCFLNAADKGTEFHAEIVRPIREKYHSYTEHTGVYRSFRVLYR